jgi:hypothetical protein
MNVPLLGASFSLTLLEHLVKNGGSVSMMHAITDTLRAST